MNVILNHISSILQLHVFISFLLGFICVFVIASGKGRMLKLIKYAYLIPFELAWDCIRVFFSIAICCNAVLRG